MGEWGIHFYAGAPRTGKTTHALTQIAETVKRTGCPVLGIDSTGAENLEHYPHVSTWREALEHVVGKRSHAFYTPKDEKEFRALMAGIAKVSKKIGGVIILVDEIGFWISARTMPKELEKTLRAFQHLNIQLHATSQSAADFSNLARSCASVFWCFRVNEGEARERVEKIFGFDPGVIGNLQPGQAVKWTAWEGVHQS